MKDRQTCQCICHRNPSVKHIIPCCSGKFKISEAALKAISESALDDAFSQDKNNREADRQRAIQNSVANSIKQTANPGKTDTKDTEPKDKEPELDEDDPLNTGAPTRAVGQAPGQGQQQQTPQAPQVPQAPQQIDADAIIDKFNVIRSGRSLNDRGIRDATKQYLGTLTPPQLKAAFSILQQMAQIVQPAVQPRVQAPPEEPSAMQNARLQMLQKKTQQSQAPAPPPPAAAAPQQTQQPPPEDEEENLPPIRVGSRTSEAVKRKMKLLIQE